MHALLRKECEHRQWRFDHVARNPKEKAVYFSSMRLHRISQRHDRADRQRHQRCWTLTWIWFGLPTGTPTVRPTGSDNSAGLRA